MRNSNYIGLCFFVKKTRVFKFFTCFDCEVFSQESWEQLLDWALNKAKLNGDMVVIQNDSIRDEYKTWTVH